MTADQLVAKLEDSSVQHKEIEYKENNGSLFYKKYKYCVYFVVSNAELRLLLHRKDTADLLNSSLFNKNKSNATKAAKEIFNILEKYSGKYRKRIDYSLFALYSNETSIYKEILGVKMIELSLKKPVAISSVTQLGKLYRKKSEYSYRVILKDKRYEINEINALIQFYEKNKEIVNFSPKLKHNMYYRKKNNTAFWQYNAFIDVKSEKLISMLALIIGDNIKQKLEIVNSPHDCKI